MDWFAFRVMGGTELRVKEKLVARGYRCDVPVERVFMRRSPKAGTAPVKKAIVQGYVFAAFPEKRPSWDTLRSLGVAGVIMSDGLPARLTLADIVRMRGMVKEAVRTRLNGSRRAFRIGDPVTAVFGALVGHAAVLESADGKGAWLRLDEPILGTRRVKYPLEALEAA